VADVPNLVHEIAIYVARNSYQDDGVKRLAGIAFVAACAYHGGTFSDIHGSFDGQQQTIGCVDISVAKSDDPSGEGPVITYAFGNRCRYAVPLDFTAIHVRGRTADGATHDLVAFDPRHEIQPLSIDALITGRENIEYVAHDRMVEVCVDLSGITNAPAQAPWVCP
jgi:hypothetical protein